MSYIAENEPDYLLECRVNYYVECYRVKNYGWDRVSIKHDVEPFVREVVKSGKTFKQVYRELKKRLEDICNSIEDYISDYDDRFYPKLKIAERLKDA